jgi:septum formation protein
MSSTTQKLILASSSPRRADLLRAAGLLFEIIPPTADEQVHPDETPVEFAMRAACEKAESVDATNRIVLGADTTVVIEGKILGKPKDDSEAKAMLHMLSGKTHEVITGVCLRTTNHTLTFHAATQVLFRELSEEEICAYVKSGEPMDKAGAYAIQGGAAGMVRRIDGSYSNIVGLPLCEVIEALETL